MRKLLALMVMTVLLNAGLKAQYVNIPDSNFRNYLRETYPTCFNAAGQLDTTCSAILNEDSLNISPWSWPGMNFQVTNINYEGLRYFKNVNYLVLEASPTGPVQELPPSLKHFDSRSANITTFLTLPPTLQILNCRSNFALQSLPALPNGLKYLDCSYCYQLTSLPLLPESLTYLKCNISPITALPNIPAGLKKLFCDQCQYLVTIPTFPPLMAMDSIDLSGCSVRHLPSLPDSLTYLNCPSNGLDSLPSNLPRGLKYMNVSGNPFMSVSLPELPVSLEKLICNANFIQALPPLPPALTYLACSQTQIQELPTLPASLIYLSCGGSYLQALPALPPALTYLDCSSSQFHELPALPATLTYLNCSNNKSIVALPALPPQLTFLDFNYANVTNFPIVPNTVRYLDCNSNPLHTIPSLPDSLRYFNCSSDSLFVLPALPKYLSELDCSYNLLTELPTLYTTNIYKLKCSHNNITCLPVLPKMLPPQDDPYALPSGNLNFDNKITCIPNIPEGRVQFQRLSPHPNFPAIDIINEATPPLCNPVNNSNHCASFPVIQGKVFYDNNANGIYNIGELVKKNVRVSLSNGAFTFTDNNGFFEIGVDSLGTYNLSIPTPARFNAVPASYQYNFSSFDTLVVTNFALQPNAIVDSLSLFAIPINWAARPGFSFPILFNYENLGTTTLSPTISFNYDNTRLTYDSSSNLAVTNNGSSLVLNVGSFVPSQQGSFVAYFRVKPTAVIGDSIKSTAIITANMLNISTSLSNVVKGSFDPNDKQATPQLSPLQVASGNYIDYTIRFQNTGNDTAFNIVVTDTLSSFLQMATLQMIASSHPCKTSVKGNKISFEFFNILLPDSNTNETKSHGFVSFKLKPISTVVVGTDIPNKAAIYFDYNSPIITNTAITKIKQFSVVPLQLISFTASRQSNNNALLVWTTSNEINVQNFEVEQSYNGQRFSTIGVELAKGRQYNNYNKIVAISNEPIVYYRLKMIDRDGQFIYSNIVAVKRNSFTTPVSILNNPANTTLAISVQGNELQNTVGRIINAQGAVVLSVLLHNNTQQVDISKLPNGNYVLQTLKGSSQFIILK